MTMEELFDKLKKAGWKPLTWQTDEDKLRYPTLSNIIDTFPSEGWIHLVRSPVNRGRWWCKYEPLSREECNKGYTEKWGDSAEEAAGELWILRKEKGLIS